MMRAPLKKTAKLRPLLAAIFGCAISGLLYWRYHTPLTLGVLLFSGTLLLLTLLVPRAAAPLHAALERLGLLLARVFSFLILGALFLLLFTPVRVLLALLGKDPLRRKWAPGEPSYWTPLPQTKPGDATRFGHQS